MASVLISFHFAIGRTCRRTRSRLYCIAGPMLDQPAHFSPSRLSSRSSPINNNFSRFKMLVTKWWPARHSSRKFLGRIDGRVDLAGRVGPEPRRASPQLRQRPRRRSPADRHRSRPAAVPEPLNHKSVQWKSYRPGGQGSPENIGGAGRLWREYSSFLQRPGSRRSPGSRPGFLVRCGAVSPASVSCFNSR